MNTRRALKERFENVRETSTDLCRPLEAEDYRVSTLR